MRICQKVFWKCLQKKHQVLKNEARVAQTQIVDKNEYLKPKAQQESCWGC